VKLEIGGGLALTPGFVNLDPVHGEGDLRRHVEAGIPLAPDSVDEARASHVLEHVPTTFRIFVFNEVWRVLRPGGTFTVIVPLFPDWGAIADPTHVSYWVKESFDYFTGRMVPCADYGIRLWEPVSWDVRTQGFGREGHAVLRKPA
jgi:predicted SAM-dependent methyltransferase